MNPFSQFSTTRRAGHLGCPPGCGFKIGMCLFCTALLGAFAAVACAGEKLDPVSASGEQQLPRAMHTRMKDRPVITVGLRDADIVGADNRALQAAVDYVSGLGGGTVQISEGEFLMRDSLHLRSFVTVRGIKGKTILHKGRAAVSPLALDGDYGEEQITIANPDGFNVGYGLSIWDSQSGGFHTTVARITGQNGSAFSIDMPLNADCMVANKAQAATVFPVVSGYDIEGVRVENLIIDGNKDENVYLNGCRGGGIFLYRGFGTVIENCVVKNYHGDGISFQQSNDVIVQNCISEDNTGLGLHPGSGSQRPVVRECVARRNGEDGLYLCWRVKYGLFERNIFENNGRFGISIGHKDTDNVLQENQVFSNGQDGVFFRNESAGMAGHRNRLENNVIENNGLKDGVAGIRVSGETRNLVFRNNIIRDTRSAGTRKQAVGIRIEPEAGEVVLEGNTIEAQTTVEDLRAAKP
ncbi:MAG TPA: right-handed parallel beta-helix repeat-containing protein [Candidatus Angelobacter sp.]|nr:right-handed parallel beta-helix repeat-containing protein [Candidatus Angelobacter sp.]